MKKNNFEQTIKLIHKEINVKLVKTNTELDKFLSSSVTIIPKLGNYFFKKEVNNYVQCYVYYQVK